MKPITLVAALALGGCCIQPASDDWLSYDPDDRPTSAAPADEPEEPREHEEPREEPHEEEREYD